MFSEMNARPTRMFLVFLREGETPVETILSRIPGFGGPAVRLVLGVRCDISIGV